MNAGSSLGCSTSDLDTCKCAWESSLDGPGHWEPVIHVRDQMVFQALGFVWPSYTNTRIDGNHVIVIIMHLLWPRESNILKIPFKMKEKLHADM